MKGVVLPGFFPASCNIRCRWSVNGPCREGVPRPTPNGGDPRTPLAVRARTRVPERNASGDACRRAPVAQPPAEELGVVSVRAHEHLETLAGVEASAAAPSAPRRLRAPARRLRHGAPPERTARAGAADPHGCSRGKPRRRGACGAVAVRSAHRPARGHRRAAWAGRARGGPRAGSRSPRVPAGRWPRSSRSAWTDAAPGSGRRPRARGSTPPRRRPRRAAGPDRGSRPR